MRQIRWYLIIWMTLLIATAVGALDQEKIYRDLISGIRCPVCESQSLAESQTDSARELRDRIRQWVESGKDQKTIMADIDKEYGEDKRLTPRLKSSTLVLWATPYLVTLLCLWVLVLT
jgi:cytochrome c-type biogenesis protein CcmH